jgi:hypothetical protein
MWPMMGSRAHSSQRPWIRAGSIRDNITLGRFFDETHYQQVGILFLLKQPRVSSIESERGHDGRVLARES